MILATPLNIDKKCANVRFAQGERHSDVTHGVAITTVRLDDGQFANDSVMVLRLSDGSRRKPECLDRVRLAGALMLQRIGSMAEALDPAVLAEVPEVNLSSSAIR